VIQQKVKISFFAALNILIILRSIIFRDRLKTIISDDIRISFQKLGSSINRLAKWCSNYYI